jgi:hypothetical protein
MTWGRILAATAIVLCAFIPNLTSAQTAKDLVGTWRMRSNVSLKPDGSKVEVFGAHGTGLAIFEPDGHFAIVNLNPDTPKFASDNRAQGTPEENKEAVLGSIALYDTYSVTGNINFEIEGSTYPNWTGTQQKRNITALTSNEIKWSLAASIGGTNEVTWSRLK